MKKIFLFLILFFSFIFLGCKTLSTPDEQIFLHKYKIAKQHYPWLNKEVHSTIEYYCNYWKDIYELDIYEVCALIKEESGTFCSNDLEKMKKVVSRSGAIGIMQVMPFHARNPKNLYSYDFNIKKGTWYFAMCMKKAKGDIREASRMYNAGLNNKRWKYKNWKYVNRIYKNHLKFTLEIDTHERFYVMR